MPDALIYRGGIRRMQFQRQRKKQKLRLQQCRCQYSRINLARSISQRAEHISACLLMYGKNRKLTLRQQARMNGWGDTENMAQYNAGRL